MPTLTEIAHEWREIEALLDESAGVVTPEIEARMAAFNLAEADKVDGYIHTIQDLRDRAEIARRQAAELTARAKTFDGRAEWLEQRLADYMAAQGVRELRGQVRRAKWVKNGGKAPVELLVEADDLPYPLSVTLGRKANLKLIGEALDDPAHPYHKDAMHYARLLERGESLRFY